MEKIIIKKDRCKACGLCVANCPKKALSLGNDLNANGYRHVVVDMDACIACGTCYVVCPDGVYTIVGNKKEVAR